MRRRTFGSTGIEVPVIGQGTWQLGYGDRRQAIDALRAGLDLGATHLDTAEGYGESEEIVAEALQGRRDEVFLVSKVSPSHATKEGMLQACEGSLSRLRTDRLDCYLLHWPSSEPLAQTIAGFEALLEQGKIRSYGVSNFDLDDLRAAVELAGENKIACNQVLLNLQARYAEAALLEYCREHHIALVSYSPFGKGDFPAPQSEGGRVLEDIAVRRGLSPRQVALAFLVRSPEVFTIPKAGKPEHARANAEAGEVELSQDEIRRLVEAFPAGQRSLPTA